MPIPTLPAFTVKTSVLLASVIDHPIGLRINGARNGGPIVSEKFRVSIVVRAAIDCDRVGPV